MYPLATPSDKRMNTIITMSYFSKISKKLLKTIRARKMVQVNKSLLIQMIKRIKARSRNGLSSLSLPSASSSFSSVSYLSS